MPRIRALLIVFFVFFGVEGYASNDCQEARRECMSSCRGMDRDSRRDCGKDCGQSFSSCMAEQRAAAGLSRTPPSRTPSPSSVAQTSQFSSQQFNSPSIADDAPIRYQINLPNVIKSMNDDEPREMPLKSSRIDQYSGPSKLKFLACDYEKPGAFDPSNAANSSRKINFWFGARPAELPYEQSTNNMEKLALQRIKATTVDKALTSCPVSWGAALETALGSGVWDEVAKTKVQQKQQETVQRENETREADRWQNQQNAWKDGAVANSADRDEELYKIVNQGISEIEAAYPNIALVSMSGKKSYTTIMQDTVLKPQKELVRSAWAQGDKLLRGNMTWKDFDRWEQGVGGKATLSLVRIAKLFPQGYYGPDMQLMSMHWDMLEMYRGMVEKVGLLEPSWQQQALKAVAARPQPASSERTANDAYPSSGVSTVRTTFVPASQYAAYVVGRNMGEGAGAALKGAMQIKAFKDKLNANLRSGRSTFWACYAKRCNDNGQSYSDYMQALGTKDYWLTYIEALNASLVMGRTGNEDSIQEGGRQLLGVDNGVNSECETAFGKVWGPFHEWKRYGVSVPMELLPARLSSPEFVEYVACRDRMEYLLRAR